MADRALIYHSLIGILRFLQGVSGFRVRVLLTAFEPYEQWAENSSWLTLVELLRGSLDFMEVVTRRYPVDLPRLRQRLLTDLRSGFDTVLHLGQCPGSPVIKLEPVATNFAGRVDHEGAQLRPILHESPLAYQSDLPVGRWVGLLRDQALPAAVSYHAGTFLCNATMYLSLHHGQQLPHGRRVGFVHLPLTTQQVAHSSTPLPCLPVTTLAQAVRLLLQDLAGLGPPAQPRRLLDNYLTPPVP